MPPVELGAVIGLFLAMVFGLRKPFIRYLVESCPLIYQPFRQFLAEHLLFITAGLAILAANNMALDIPVSSGIKFFVGFLGFGFFISLDMALHRERTVIRTVKKAPPLITHPTRLDPRARKFFFLALTATLYVMVIISLIILQDLDWIKSIHPDKVGALIPETTSAIFKEMSFIMAVLLIMSVNIIYSYATNLRLLFTNETGVLRRVSSGDLSRLVPVATNDEFGVIASYTNTMIHALRDRIRMLSNLKVAKEAQKNLLPGKDPGWPGLDIAGTLIYCEEVGGDHYDFFELPRGKYGVAVTDSAGHGVGSAFHMATTRALLRFGAEQYDDAVDLVGRVNRHLTRDSYETGRFTTLFFLEIDPGTRTLTWVRSGHEPAFFYDASSESITKLTGEGMALGVCGDLPVKDNRICNWATGSVLLIITDGIKESRNPAGVMFGEDRIKAALKQAVSLEAAGILAHLTGQLNNFRGATPIEDDVTLVVVRLL